MKPWKSVLNNLLFHKFLIHIPVHLKYTIKLRVLIISSFNYEMMPVPVQSAKTGPPGSCAEYVSLAHGENEEKPLPGWGGSEAESVGLEPEPTNLAQPPAKSKAISEVVWYR